jgi:hypothetical protein
MPNTLIAAGAGGSAPTTTGTTASSQSQSNLTTGWWVFVAVLVTIGLSGTQIAWAPAGIMSIATIYQLQQVVTKKGT